MTVSDIELQAMTDEELKSLSDRASFTRRDRECGTWVDGTGVYCQLHKHDTSTPHSMTVNGYDPDGCPIVTVLTWGEPSRIASLRIG